MGEYPPRAGLLKLAETPLAISPAGQLQEAVTAVTPMARSAIGGRTAAFGHPRLPEAMPGAVACAIRFPMSAATRTVEPTRFRCVASGTNQKRKSAK